MFKELEIVLGYEQTMILMGFNQHSISYLLSNSLV